jgi:hypothetical protein
MLERAPRVFFTCNRAGVTQLQGLRIAEPAMGPFVVVPPCSQLPSLTWVPGWHCREIPEAQQNSFAFISNSHQNIEKLIWGVGS